MAVRKRGERWVADYYDGFNIRRWKTFDTKTEAKDFEAAERGRKKESGGLAPTVDPDTTLTVYGEKWLKDCTARGVKSKTLISVEGALRLHVLPRLGGLRVRDVTRPGVRQLLLAKLADGELARGTVKHLFMTVSGVLSSAVEDGLIKANPLRGLWKTVGKAGKAEGPTKGAEEILALNSADAATLLRVARNEAPEHFPAIATMMLAGLRVGEALALLPAKVNFSKSTIRVDRQLIGTTKDNEPRTVDMAAGLAAIVAPLVEQRSAPASALAKVVSITGAPQGSQDAPTGPWLFYPELGPSPTTKDEQRVYKNLARAFRRVLRRAGLPEYHSPKSLRHTFGSQLISRGVSPAYVQQQMGHASVALTVDTYGSWLPVQAAGAVNGLADDVLRRLDGSSLVAAAVPEAAGGL